MLIEYNDTTTGRVAAIPTAGSEFAALLIITLSIPETALVTLNFETGAVGVKRAVAEEEVGTSVETIEVGETVGSSLFSTALVTFNFDTGAVGVKIAVAEEEVGTAVETIEVGETGSSSLLSTALVTFNFDTVAVGVKIAETKEVVGRGLETIEVGEGVGFFIFSPWS
jgi:hypothetical protein